MPFSMVVWRENGTLAATQTLLPLTVIVRLYLRVSEHKAEAVKFPSGGSERSGGGAGETQQSGTAGKTDEKILADLKAGKNDGAESGWPELCESKNAEPYRSDPVSRAAFGLSLAGEN